MNYTIHTGDNRDTLKTLEDASVDAIVTDPPYGIDFLGKAWDANTGALETYRECLRVLKPGGYILAFSAARTYHHLAVTLEQAGFDVRDQLMWLYSSGFPKAQDIGKSIQRRQGVEETKSQSGLNAFKEDNDLGWVSQDKSYGKKKDEVVCTSPEAQQWAGWKTALKPSHEPICMARKPFKGSTIDNVLTHGVGALNIDATRIGWNDTKDKETASKGRATPSYSVGGGNYAPNDENQEHYKQNEQGRFPSNVIGEVEGYQKYFYCPKVSRKERHIGFENPMTNSDMIEALGATLSGDGQTVSIPGLYDIKIHGLKHEYEKIKGKQDPLAHIETLSNYSQGDVKNHPLWDPSIGTNVQRLKHKILEHNKDLSKKEIPTEQSMLDDMGGYYCDSNGNRQENAGKVVKLPHLSGTIQIHGLKEEYRKWCEANNKTVNVGNNHPTVKPVALMRYLIKLVTPANSTVLDPFTGSGSTGMAAVELGHTFIGCELDPNYVAIARRRIEAWNTEEYDNMFKELFE